LPKGTEGASILIGQVAFLKEPIMAMYRLSQAKILSDWCEIATETRFVFLALGPKSRGSSVWELSERGRAVAVLLGDKVSQPLTACATSSVINQLACLSWPKFYIYIFDY